MLLIASCLWKKFLFRERVWAREEIVSFEDFEPVLDGVMVGVSMTRTLKENEQWELNQGLITCYAGAWCSAER